eukprot:351596_1
MKSDQNRYTSFNHIRQPHSLHSETTTKHTQNTHNSQQIQTNIHHHTDQQNNSNKAHTQPKSNPDTIDLYKSIYPENYTYRPPQTQTTKLLSTTADEPNQRKQEQPTDTQQQQESVEKFRIIERDYYPHQIRALLTSNRTHHTHNTQKGPKNIFYSTKYNNTTATRRRFKRHKKQYRNKTRIIKPHQTDQKNQSYKYDTQPKSNSDTNPALHNPNN